MNVQLIVTLKGDQLNLAGVPDGENGWPLASDILLAAARMAVKQAIDRAKAGPQGNGKIILPTMIPPKGPIRVD